MPELSRRGQRYLDTLDRYPAVPVATVKQALIDKGYPVFDQWLDFHDRYAGYEEAIGLDGVIWGLKHTHSRYLPGLAGRAMEVDAYINEFDGIWYAVAADVHPGYDYTIDQLGHFPKLDSSSFEIYIEREGLWLEFMQLGEKPRGERDSLLIASAIENTADATRLEDLSDEYTEWWQGTDIIAQREVEPAGRWLQALIR